MEFRVYFKRFIWRGRGTFREAIPIFTMLILSTENKEEERGGGGDDEKTTEQSLSLRGCRLSPSVSRCKVKIFHLQYSSYINLSSTSDLRGNFETDIYRCSFRKMQNNRDTHHRRREKSAGAKESIRRFRHFFPSRSEIGASHTPPRSLVPHPCSFLGQRDDLCFPPLLFSPFPLFLTPPLFTSHPSFLSLSLSLPSPFFLYLFLLSIWEGRSRLRALRV